MAKDLTQNFSADELKAFETNPGAAIATISELRNALELLGNDPSKANALKGKIDFLEELLKRQNPQNPLDQAQQSTKQNNSPLMSASGSKPNQGIFTSLEHNQEILRNHAVFQENGSAEIRNSSAKEIQAAEELMAVFKALGFDVKKSEYQTADGGKCIFYGIVIPATYPGPHKNPLLMSREEISEAAKYIQKTPSPDVKNNPNYPKISSLGMAQGKVEAQELHELHKGQVDSWSEQLRRKASTQNLSGNAQLGRESF